MESTLYSYWLLSPLCTHSQNYCRMRTSERLSLKLSSQYEGTRQGVACIIYLVYTTPGYRYSFLNIHRTLYVVFAGLGYLDGTRFSLLYYYYKRSRNVITEITSKPSRLKLLGVNVCQKRLYYRQWSLRHYRLALISLNPFTVFKFSSWDFADSQK